MGERCPCCGQVISAGTFGNIVEEGPLAGLPSRIAKALAWSRHGTREKVRELVEEFSSPGEEFTWSVMVRNLGPKSEAIVEEWLQEAPQITIGDSAKPEREDRGGLGG
jgi:hypothetical protein